MDGERRETVISKMRFTHMVSSLDKEDDRARRVLVATNHLAAFAGSEILALDVAKWFLAKGDEVTLAANHVARPLSEHIPDAVRVETDLGRLAVGDYDLIWCQHDVLSLIPIASWREACDASRIPFVVYASLSPYEPIEHIDPLMWRALSADLMANSEETKAKQIERGHGLIRPNQVEVFYNAVDGAFWRTCNPGVADPPTAPSRMAVISNHIPAELDAALRLLEQRGVDVRRIGQAHDYHLVAPADMMEIEACITIGRSVVYAMATRTPVFLYDRFGGDGWLTRDTFQNSGPCNFSGRPACRRLSPEEIVTELLDGFSQARAEMSSIGTWGDLDQFTLDTHLGPARRRALDPDLKLQRQRTFDRHLKSRAFCAHLEASRLKHIVLTQWYLHIVRR